MASTSYRRVASFNAGGWNVNLESRTTANFSRSNNTISASSARVDVRFASDSVATSFSGFNIVGSYTLPQGTDRRTNTGVGSGTWNRGDTKSTSNQSFSFSVSNTATTTNTNNGAGVNSASWGGGQSMTIPAAGLPTGLGRTAASITTTTATLGASVSSWGTNCTAGSGQRIEYKKSSASSYTNLAYSTATSHTRAVTGLTSNSRYNVRSYVSNGAGRTATSSVLDFYTLPLAPSAGAPIFEATTVTVPTTQNSGDGSYAITKQYRYQAVGGEWSAWTTYTGNDVVITDLLPSTDYNLQLRSTTTAGTTTGAIISLTTMPAGKIVMPDGDVLNAIPRVVHPNGDVEMVNVTMIG